MLLDLSRYTVESVLRGHPDKICDQIADAVLDAFLKADCGARVAIECLGVGNHLVLGGEVSSKEGVNAEEIARDVYRDIGYREPLHITNLIQIQSPQLRRAVDAGTAGDQGVIYGFACASGYNYLPYGVFAVNAMAKAIDTLRHRTGLFLPDGKLQVTIRDSSVETLVISVQHDSAVAADSLRQTIIENAVGSITTQDSIERVFFNHNSLFVAGGFANDTGLSGRK